MTFATHLENVTGTQLEHGELQLMNPAFTRFDTRYCNSGVWKPRDLPTDSLQFDTAPEGCSAFFQLGDRLRPTLLNIPPHTTQNTLHGHPGGEWTYVIDGSYIDADVHGRALRTYKQGEVIFYNKGSTHNPLSVDGARALYLPFNGIVFGTSPEDLTRKMIKVGTPAEALEYAVLWMVPDKRERADLLAKLDTHVLDLLK